MAQTVLPNVEQYRQVSPKPYTNFHMTLKMMSITTSQDIRLLHEICLY